MRPYRSAESDRKQRGSTLKTLDAELVGTWRLSHHFSLIAEVDYRDTASTDTRIEYDRTRYALSLVWEL